MSAEEIAAEFSEIFEPTESRPVMSKPPRARASLKLKRQVQTDLAGRDVSNDAHAWDVADWVADKMERFGARTARPVFTMDGRGPVCSWCDGVWPLCGCHHLSESLPPDDDNDDVQAVPQPPGRW